ncbi:hypothetical protein MTO96_028344 [Rhipicephalus appendiculatus]
MLMKENIYRVRVVAASQRSFRSKHVQADRPPRPDFVIGMADCTSWPPRRLASAILPSGWELYQCSTSRFQCLRIFTVLCPRNTKSFFATSNGSSRCT